MAEKPKTGQKPFPAKFFLLSHKGLNTGYLYKFI